METEIVERTPKGYVEKIMTHKTLLSLPCYYLAEYLVGLDCFIYYQTLAIKH